MKSEPMHPQTHAVREGEAHVWTVALQPSPAELSALLRCLSREERERTERHRSADAQRRFALTRLALRHILAGYTGIAPEALELVVDAQGKPHLAGAAGLYFSVSHAERLALIAVAGAAVGVDVERIREPPRLLLIARRVLHEDTVAVLSALSGDARQRAFLDAWTQREAHVKAVGGGLFMTPDVLPVDVAQPADGIPYIREERRGRARWSVTRFQPAADARASIVARGDLRRVCFYDWSIDDLNAREVP